MLDKNDAKQTDICQLRKQRTVYYQWTQRTLSFDCQVSKNRTWKTTGRSYYMQQEAFHEYWASLYKNIDPKTLSSGSFSWKTLLKLRSIVNKAHPFGYSKQSDLSRQLSPSLINLTFIQVDSVSWIQKRWVNCNGVWILIIQQFRKRNHE